jgi:hypothetical protein
MAQLEQRPQQGPRDMKRKPPQTRWVPITDAAESAALQLVRKYPPSQIHWRLDGGKLWAIANEALKVWRADYARTSGDKSE